MTQERLNQYMLLAIYKEKTDNFSLNFALVVKKVLAFSVYFAKIRCILNVRNLPAKISNKTEK